VPDTTVARLRTGGPVQHDRIPTEKLANPVDLRGKKIDQFHRLVFTEKKNTAEGGFDFLINGKVFDPNRVDEVMTLGQLNEWTLVNKTTEWHTFHIHVNDFQVVSVKAPPMANVSSGPAGVTDVAPGAVDPMDTVLMPPHSTIKLLTRPTDFTGTFVYHCHMTFHEDHGMMGVVKVVAAS
jgi:suppressor of ftsI